MDWNPSVFKFPPEWYAYSQIRFPDQYDPIDLEESPNLLTYKKGGLLIKFELYMLFLYTINHDYDALRKRFGLYKEPESIKAYF